MSQPEKVSSHTEVGERVGGVSIKKKEPPRGGADTHDAREKNRMILVLSNLSLQSPINLELTLFA